MTISYLHRRIVPILLLAGIVFLVLPTHLTAQDSGEAPQGARPAQDDTAPREGAGGAGEPAEQPAYDYEDPDFNEGRVSYPLMILRTIAVMGVIIIGIYFLFRLLLKNRNRLVTDSEIVTVLVTYPLAANRIIQVVDIGGQVLVLGVSESNINLITELEDQEVIDRIKLSSSKEKTGTATFRDTFMNLIGGKAFTKPGQISHLSSYKRRINRMRKF